MYYQRFWSGPGLYFKKKPKTKRKDQKNTPPPKSHTPKKSKPLNAKKNLTNKPTKTSFLSFLPLNHTTLAIQWVLKHHKYNLHYLVPTVMHLGTKSLHPKRFCKKEQRCKFECWPMNLQTELCHLTSFFLKAETTLVATLRLKLIEI